MKAWITKYAMTGGIKEVDDGEISGNFPNLLRAKSLGAFALFHGEGREWHRTYAGARQKAMEMQTAKIKSLEKSLAKIKAIKF